MIGSRSERLRALAPVGAAAGSAALALAVAPNGIVLLGVVLGSVNALLAVGLVLVYRSNRIINFAHGEIGASAAVLSVLLVFEGWNYFFAVALGLFLAACGGAITEVAVVRRFRTAPRLLLTVATIGVAQVFAFVSLALPSLFDLQVVPQDFSTPLSSWRFRVDPVVFDGNYVLVLAFAAVAAVALTVLLNRTSVGIGVLASAENADRAALCGIPVKSLSTLVWVIASLLSAAAAILQAPIVGLSIGSLVGSGLLLRGLAAAVIGRMQSLPTTVAAAIALGVFEQTTLFRYGRSPIVDAVLLLVILGGLLLQRRSLSRIDPGDTSTWQAVAQPKPVPRSLAALPEVRWGRRAILLAGLVGAVLLPRLLSEADQILATAIVIWALVGASLVVLTGWSGQISLGQFALVGIGAAASGTLTAEAGTDFVFAVIAGAVAGASAALILGLPALRLRGFFLAVTTLAFAVATDSYFLSLAWVAPDGVVERPMLFGRIDLESEYAFYLVCGSVLLAVVFLLHRVRGSAAGRAITAVRDNDRAAQATGASAVVARLSAFALSGAIAGAAGGLLVHHQHRLQPSQFDPSASIAAFTMAVIGGLGSIPGALLGAGYVRGVQDFAPGEWSVLATGIGLLVLLLVLPGGLGALVYRARDGLLRQVARRRGIAVPGITQDSRVQPGTSSEEAGRDPRPAPARADVEVVT